MRIETYSDHVALLRALGTLRQQAGLTPRGILFLALSSQGRIYLGIPDEPAQIVRGQHRHAVATGAVFTVLVTKRTSSISTWLASVPSPSSMLRRSPNPSAVRPTARPSAMRTGLAG